MMRKKVALCISLVLLLTSGLFLNSSIPSLSVSAEENLRMEDFLNMDELEGWAAVPANGLPDGVTGGGNATPQIVQTAAELKTALQGNTPRVIVVKGTITTSGVLRIEYPNKTIVGYDEKAKIIGGIGIYDTINIIISNLTFEGKYPGSQPPDCILVQGAQHLWVNHCDIHDAPDGNLDLVHGADYITVSWCKFWYQYAENQHRYSNLVASGDEHDYWDRDKLKISYHHNWWAENVNSRMPRTRFGKLHVYNNYYSTNNNATCIAAGAYTSMLIENNYFKDVRNPHNWFSTSDNFPEYIAASGNAYDNTSGSQNKGLDGGRWGYVGPYVPPYNYRLDAVNDIPAIVQSLAGPHTVPYNLTPPTSKPKPLVSLEPKPSTPAVPTFNPTPTQANPITYDEGSKTYTYHGQNTNWNGYYLIDNPFKGEDFSEDVTYTKENNYQMPWKNGVTITYQVNLPATATDAPVLTFNLSSREINNRDKLHYKSCQDYSQDDPDYDLGTLQTYVDATGREFSVLANAGGGAKYNPDYPKGGCYEVSKSRGIIPAYRKGTDPSNAANWTYLKYIGDGGLYEAYSKKHDESGGGNSLLSEGKINGSFSIFASGSVGFRQDNVTGVQLNSNLDSSKQRDTFQVYNEFSYNGNGGRYSISGKPKTPTMEDKGIPHFVVVVIQNDWVQFYMDGKEITLDYLNWRGEPVLPTGENAVDPSNAAGRTFNLGHGMKKKYWPDNVYPEDTNAMTLMEFITNEDTVLTVGGKGFAADVLYQDSTQYFGTPAGVQVKDLSFFDYAIPEEYIINQTTAIASHTPVPRVTPTPSTPKPTRTPLLILKGDVNFDGEVDLKDVQMALKAYLKLVDLTPEGFTAADVNEDDEVDLKDVQLILKAYLKLI